MKKLLPQSLKKLLLTLKPLLKKPLLQSKKQLLTLKPLLKKLLLLLKKLLLMPKPLSKKLLKKPLSKKLLKKSLPKKSLLKKSPKNQQNSGTWAFWSTLWTTNSGHRKPKAVSSSRHPEMMSMPRFSPPMVMTTKKCRLCVTSSPSTAIIPSS